jgi:hypothetical protein
MTGIRKLYGGRAKSTMKVDKSLQKIANVKRCPSEFRQHEKKYEVPKSMTRFTYCSNENTILESNNPQI